MLRPPEGVEMWGWLVQRRVRRVFASLSEGDWQAVVPGLASDVHHRFAGDHPLGGERHRREDVALWFGRLYRLFPSLRFAVSHVLVAGPPWDLHVTVQWSAEVSPVVGDPYVNVGAHVLHIRRGRVTQLDAYEDSQAVARACARMVELGVDEAGAPPITSPVTRT